MFQIVKPGSNFDFIGKQKAFLGLSTLLILGSLLLLFVKGPNYGIDFRGGSDIILSFEEEVSSEQVRDAAAQAGLEDASVQRFGSGERAQFLVQTREVSVVNAETIPKIAEKIEEVAPLKNQSWSPEQPDRFDIELGESVDTDALRNKVEEVDGLEGITVEEAPTSIAPNAYVIKFQDLGARIRAGFEEALPDAFNEETGLERLETVGARVGEQLREDGLTAVLLALVAILIYIAARFDIRYAPGAVAALFHDVLFSMGVLTLVGMEINLPILASILTIVGYSLNDTIVVFDRIRENYTAGHGGSNLREIINTSLNETLSRTLITSLTTLFAVGIIAWLGSGLIENFAWTLVIGVLVGTYSSIFIASPILLAMDTFLRNQQKAKELRASQKAKAEDAAGAEG